VSRIAQTKSPSVFSMGQNRVAPSDLLASVQEGMPLPIKILVVDDHTWILRTLRSLLDEQHWQVFEAENGKTALEIIHQENPDVVVLDIFMPEMNGLETACEIRRLLPVPKLILMSSGYTSDEAAVLARLYGDGHFIQKSELGRELVPAINRLFECASRSAVRRTT
jgi:DNA-binding response OmpR family regulator